MTAERTVPDVRLVPLEPEAARARLVVTMHEYGQAGVEVGWWDEDVADARAQRVTDELLPHGVETSGHRFWSLVLGNGSIAGWLWVGPSRNGSTWWIYDILVDPPYRGRGVAAGALRALDAEARAAGQPVIGLHVLTINETAHALYLREGFTDIEGSADGTGIIMERRVTR